MARDRLISKQTHLLCLLQIVLCKNIASWCPLAQPTAVSFQMGQFGELFLLPLSLFSFLFLWFLKDPHLLMYRPAAGQRDSPASFSI